MTYQGGGRIPSRALFLFYLREQRLSSSETNASLGIVRNFDWRCIGYKIESVFLEHIEHRLARKPARRLLTVYYFYFAFIRTN